MGRVIRRRKPRSNGGLREGGGIREQILPLLNKYSSVKRNGHVSQVDWDGQWPCPYQFEVNVWVKTFTDTR